MVSAKSVEAQLKRLNFNYRMWGKSETNELHRILVPDEEIYECVNGFYEGGFALLVATDLRVLLIDKKPLNYLTVEDVRFDMINEIDYNHRLTGAYITINTGAKTLKFTSFNQTRLRKLIGHVQDRMSDIKKQMDNHAESQKQHLEQLNQQLQAYLLAQQSYQMQLQQQVQFAAQTGQPVDPIQPPRPNSQLADFLFTQRLMQDFQKQSGPKEMAAQTAVQHQVEQPEKVEQNREVDMAPAHNGVSTKELYEDGMKEIFSRQLATPNPAVASPVSNPPQTHSSSAQSSSGPSQGAKLLELSPLRIAYSKLPMALRNRKFGRPSFHAHSRRVTPEVTQEPQTAT